MENSSTPPKSKGLKIIGGLIIIYFGLKSGFSPMDGAYSIGFNIGVALFVFFGLYLVYRGIKSDKAKH